MQAGWTGPLAWETVRGATTRPQECPVRPFLKNVPLCLLLLMVGGCGGEAPGEAGPVRAVVAPDRRGHFLDRPFPSDELLTARGTVDLTGFPVRGWPVARGFLRAWKRQAGEQARGFSALGAVYFRFTGPVPVAPRYASAPGDPVQLVSLDSNHRVPLRTRFVADARGDPYLPDGTLMLIPDEARPLRSGERYVAFVQRELAEPAPGWVPPREILGNVAVATVFTVQDHAGELRALGAAVDAALDAHPERLRPRGGLRRVESLAYAPTQDPAGRAVTRETVRFADGARRRVHLGPRDAPPRSLDLGRGPMAVYEAELRAPLVQPSRGRPFQSPGLWARLTRDPERADGAIPVRPGPRVPTPEAAEPLRVVVQVTRREPVRAVLLWLHGSGGDAYGAVARPGPADELPAARRALARAGVCVVSADLPPFGARFPLVDRAFDTDQGMVNPANLPAMRDTPRQAASEQRVLLRFARDVLPELLAALPGVRVARPGGRDSDAPPPALPVGVFGHSTGAQVAALAGAVHGGDGPRAMLLSGGGGFLAHYPLDAEVIELELPWLGRVPGRRVLGTLFGVPASARERLDRHHPLLVPYQLLVDGADPLAVAPHQPVPVGVFTGTGDRQVPADSARWLAAASPAGFEVPCRPTATYDGHHCAFREADGVAALARLAAVLVGEAVLPVPHGRGGGDPAGAR